MHSNRSSGSRAAPARGFMALFAMLAIGVGAMAAPAAAAPFAYVATNGGTDGTVSVIDTATNMVVATVMIPPQLFPLVGGVAVTPDGKYVYALAGDSVDVIDTATNMVVANIVRPLGGIPYGVAVPPDGTCAYVTIPSAPSDIVVIPPTPTTSGCGEIILGPPGGLDFFGVGIAFTPDGKHAYASNIFSNTVSVIDTATNTVEAATITVGPMPLGVAVNPNGKHAYVVNGGSNNVSVIETASNTVAATVAVGNNPREVAVTPDGKHAYVTNTGSNTVSVIDTATNTVEADTIPVGSGVFGIAITPDGKHAYVTNTANAVSVIATASNTVVATVPGISPIGDVAIVPPPPGVPFLAFNAALLRIAFGAAPNQDSFLLLSHFTLSSTAPGINPLTDAVTLQAGTFAITIPPGSFTKQTNGSFTFAGVIDGVSLKALIKPAGTLRYAFRAEGKGASFTGTQNAVYVTLTVGGDSGATSVTAQISGTPSVTAGISP